MITIDISEEHIALVETKKCRDCAHLHAVGWKTKKIHHRCDIDKCMANPKDNACLYFEAGEEQ